MKMKRPITIIFFVLLLGCQAPAQEIVIGGVFHLTGPGAFWGTAEYNAATLAIEEINAEGGIDGVPLKMIVEDGKTDFPQTATAFMKLIEVDIVPVIVGPTWFAQVASPIADVKKVAVISPSGGTVPQPSPYFFDVWPTERQEVIPLVAFMKSQNYTRIAVVYSQNDWSVSMKDNFVDEASRQSLHIVKEFATAPDESDFRTVILELKQLSIDAIYAPFAFYPGQGAFSKQAKELNLALPFYSSSGTENPILLEAYPEIEGTIYPYPARDEKEQEFLDKYEARFDSPPAPSAAYAYDSVRLVAEALRSGAATSAEIADYLRSVRDYQGVSNTITFDENGRVTQKPHIIKVIQEGKFIKKEENNII